MARTPALARLTLVLLLLLSFSCARRPRALVIGSKNFTEQNILAEIIAQQVESKLNIPVERRFNLGGTLLAHESLNGGAIHVYPEYTGTALIAILRQSPLATPEATLERVREEYRKAGIEWLSPLGFNNSFAIAIPGDLAREQKLEKLSEAHKYEQWRLGIGYEFLQRQDGYASLMRTYKLKQKAAPRSMDLGLLYQALEQKQVNMIAANMTDGMLAKMDVKVLEDDQGIFPPYEACIVVRTEALSSFPDLRTVLEQLSGKITGDTMRRLNSMSDVEHKPVRDIAAGFLREARLTPAP